MGKITYRILLVLCISYFIGCSSNKFSATTGYQFYKWYDLSIPYSEPTLRNIQTPSNGSYEYSFECVFTDSITRQRGRVWKDYCKTGHGGIVFIHDCSTLDYSLDPLISSYAKLYNIRFIEKYASYDVETHRYAWDEKVSNEINVSGYDSTQGYWKLILTPSYVVYGYYMMKNKKDLPIANEMIDSIRVGLGRSRMLPLAKDPEARMREMRDTSVFELLRNNNKDK